MSLSSTTIQTKISGGESTTSTNGVLSSTLTASRQYTQTLTDGTGNAKAQKIVEIEGTVTAGVPVDLDLTAATGGFPAATVNFAKVKGIQVENDAGSGGSLTLGNSGANDWLGLVDGATATTTVEKGGVLCKGSPNAGMTVDGTHKILRLVAGAGTVTYRIVIVGEGA